MISAIIRQKFVNRSNMISLINRFNKFSELPCYADIEELEVSVLLFDIISRT